MESKVKEKVEWRRVSSTHTLKDLSVPDAHHLGSNTNANRVALSIWGTVLILTGVAFGAYFVFAIGVAKFIAQPRHELVQRIKDDRYYCLLVPLTIPMLIIGVFLHWVSMKFFKHAYN